MLHSTEQLVEIKIPSKPVTYLPTSFFPSVRLLTSVVLFFGYAFQYMLKINISVAIVCMVNNTAVNSHEQVRNSSHESGCVSSSLAHGKTTDGEYMWSKSTQGMILSAYFYGYLLTQIIGGWISFKFGGRLVIAFSMILSGVFTLLIPICSEWGWVALFFCRLLVGACHGVFWPSISSIWSRWAPPSERSALAGLANSGSWVGNIVAFPLASYLCVNGFSGGWPSIFYIFGTLCILWSVLFYLICGDSPEVHCFINEDEKNYIVQQLSKVSISRSKKTPWLSILTSKACIAIYVAHFCSNFCIYLFLTQLPTFLKDVLKFDIKSNGFVSALPYVVSCFLNIASSFLSDKIIQTGKLSRTDTRRLFNGIVIGLSFVDCRHPILGVFLLVIGISFSAICWGAGHLVNINDVAGPFSGILFGISNTIATLSGILAPYLVAVATAEGQTQNEWKVVFYVSAAITFCGGVFYVIFCNADLQSWAINEDGQVNENKD